MILFPAIDLQDGKCVRLTRGKFDSTTVYSDEPWQVAKRWQDAGAEWLHVIDLDGAQQGAPQNVVALHEILRVVGIPVQFGGGVRNMHTAEMMLGLGVRRLIVGTAAIRNERFAERMFARFGDAVAVALDVRDGILTVQGWEEQTEDNAVSFAKRMESLGARRMVYTNVCRDGTLEGVDVAPVAELCESVRAPIIAAGGVRGTADIESLADVSGLEGVVIGKALYSGDFDFERGLEIARNASSPRT